MRGDEERWDWRRLGADALVLLALGGLAVTQPVLDLFGKNPEFFVAGDQGPGQIVLFAVVITLLVPVVAIGIELAVTAIDPGAGRLTHRVLVALLAMGFGLTLARELDVDSPPIALAIALAVAAVISLAEARTTVGRRLFCYLAPAPLLFLAVFLFTSDSSELIWSDEPDAVAADQTGPALDAPIVVLQLDELPLASLLRPDGSIDAERYPNFARLAEGSTWFRNASSLSESTTLSVPSVLTGVTPDPDALPSSIDHPRNLFTLLGNSHEMRVHEPITDLCPSTVCADDAPPAVATDSEAVPPPTEGDSSLFDTLTDAAVIYGHATLPDGWQSGLPDIDHSWGDFIDGVREPPATAASSIDASPPGDGQSTQGPPAEVAAVRNLIAGVEPGPSVNYAHVLLPHYPWQLSPEGYRYAAQAQFEGFEERARWTDDPDPVRQGLQRHLLQLGYVDVLIGDLIDQLEEQGLWQESMVVVTADHGTAFVPGEPQRIATESTADEIYRVPLFMKFPGQEEGEVRDDNVLLTDVLPTMVDALGLETDWEFDGRSLLDEGQDPPTTKPIHGTAGPSTIPVSLDGLFALAERNDQLLGGLDAGWNEVVGIGEHGDEVGEPVADLEPSGPADLAVDIDQQDQFDDVDLEEGFLPLLVTGTVEAAAGGSTPPELLLAVNGTVAGTAVDVDPGGSHRFSALLTASPFRDGANHVDVLVPEGDGFRLAPVVGSEGWSVEDDRLVAGSRSLPLVAPDQAHHLQVEAALDDGQALAVTGWAAGSSSPAELVLVMADGRSVGTATGRERPDLAAFGAAAVGFEANVPSGDVEDGAELTAVAVFDDLAVAVPLEIERG